MPLLLQSEGHRSEPDTKPLIFIYIFVIDSCYINELYTAYVFIVVVIIYSRRKWKSWLLYNYNDVYF